MSGTHRSGAGSRDGWAAGGRRGTCRTAARVRLADEDVVQRHGDRRVVAAGLVGGGVPLRTREGDALQPGGHLHQRLGALPAHDPPELQTHAGQPLALFAVRVQRWTRSSSPRQPHRTVGEHPKLTGSVQRPRPADDLAAFDCRVQRPSERVPGLRAVLLRHEIP